MGGTGCVLRGIQGKPSQRPAPYWIWGRGARHCTVSGNGHCHEAQESQRMLCFWAGFMAGDTRNTRRSRSWAARGAGPLVLKRGRPSLQVRRSPLLVHVCRLYCVYDPEAPQTGRICGLPCCPKIARWCKITPLRESLASGDASLTDCPRARSALSLLRPCGRLTGAI